MEPKYVVYECENCGNLFYREVANVIEDDCEHCNVNVRLVKEVGSEDIEEFPMCECLGGESGFTITKVECKPFNK